MATVSWRIGAFAERYPSDARDLGRSHAMEAASNRLLYATAGVMRAGAVSDALYGITVPMSSQASDRPPGCCGPTQCQRGQVDSCCDRSTCAGCGPAESDFDAIYEEVAAQLDEAHAFAAAIRDILTDPDVEDTGASISEATALHSDGALAALYGPSAPAKKMPDGSTATARCPICGCAVCPSCGCSCECCSSAHSRTSDQSEV